MTTSLMYGTAPLWKFAEVSPPTPELNGLTEADEVTFIPLENVWPTNKADDFQIVPWEKRLTGYTPFRRGDLLLPKVTPTVTHGRTMFTDTATELGVASTEVYTVRARPGTDPRWLAYLLVGTEFLGVAGASVQGTGGLKRISTQFVESYPLPDASSEEQRKIADYLDRETAEIDAMTADLDKMEALLAERRKATVTAAFNKFSTTAPLWKFAKVSPSTPGIYDLDKGEDVTFIPLEDVWTNQKPEVFKVAPWEDKLASYTHFESGDVLLPKVTPTVTHGRAMVANVTTKLGVATSEVYTLRPNERTNPDWLAFFLTSQTFLDEAGVSVLGTGGLKRISTQFVQSFPVPDMSRSEQDSLVKDIDRETAEIDAMLADITELRDLLAERRAALIAAAVTGQIDIPAAEEPTHA